MSQIVSLIVKQSVVLVAVAFALQRSVHGDILYHHRTYHGSAIVGDRLYIDGGEVTTWNGTGSGIQDGFGVQDGFSCYNNDTCRGNITVLPYNDTFSIDLSSSWTNQTIIPTTLNKVLPSLNQAGLWLDSTGKIFYSYGGGTSWAQAAFSIPAPPGNALNEFTPTDQGGSWSEAPQLASSNFSSLSRAAQSAYASGNGLGFALGGTQGVGTNYSIDVDTTITIPGLVMYNSSSNQWDNRSTSGYSGNDAPLGGTAHFVQSFGPEGLLFILGGQVQSSTGKNYVSTDSINFYDPISDQWKLQDVSGDPPPPSTASCVVGAKGEDGTYEIYLFGGQNDNFDNLMALGEVYVLSLPAFHWQRATQSAQVGRFSHTCNVRGRQMIVVGGFVQPRTDYIENQDNTFVSSADPWVKGIGVFDLTQLQWRESYDASLGPYQTPAIIKNTKTPRYPDSLLQDPVLSSWFRVAEPQNNSTASKSGAKTTSNKSNAGAIAGGTVGGIAGLSLIGIIVWVVLRGRSRTKESSTVSKMEPPMHEMPDARHPLATRNWRSPQESGGTPIYEKLSQSRSEAP